MATKKLYIIEEAEAYFVVREKHKMSFEVIEDKEYNNPSSGIMADQIIRFKGHKTKKQYPNKLRRVVFYDYDGNRTFVFYTNNFDVTAEQVAMLYKYRWRVELFFKWLKQHLRIKEFYGTSENVNGRTMKMPTGSWMFWSRKLSTCLLLRKGRKFILCYS